MTRGEKIPEDDRETIFFAWAILGDKQKEIAERRNISQGAVSWICSNKKKEWEAQAKAHKGKDWKELYRERRKEQIEFDRAKEQAQKEADDSDL